MSNATKRFFLTSTNKGMHAGMILRDVQKAFDTLEFSFFLIKCLDFKTPLIKWFESYQSKRQLFVSIDDVFLEAGILNCGVLQPSILGPLYFTFGGSHSFNCKSLFSFVSPCLKIN